ncbi:hypothetical protein HBI33_010730 [Parastagonospora nodorum]|nr:hypothetical protein HBI33_010730 [Parastagonospora nodorum]
MLRRSCVGSKGLVGPERCSTVPRCPYLLLRVPGAGYWRVCRLGIMSLASVRSGAVQHCPLRSSSAIMTPGRWIPKRTARGGHESGFARLVGIELHICCSHNVASDVMYIRREGWRFAIGDVRR